MGAARAVTRMPLEQQAAQLHEPVDALVVGRRFARRRKFPVQESRDAAVAVGRTGVDEALHALQHRPVLRFMIAPTGLSAALQSLDQVRPRDAERVGHGLHREPSVSGDRASKVGFFARALPSASLRISTSRVFRPS